MLLFLVVVLDCNNTLKITEMPQKSTINLWLDTISSQRELTAKICLKMRPHKKRVIKARNDYYVRLIEEVYSQWKVIQL